MSVGISRSRAARAQPLASQQALEIPGELFADRILLLYYETGPAGPCLVHFAGTVHLDEPLERLPPIPKPDALATGRASE